MQSSRILSGSSLSSTKHPIVASRRRLIVQAAVKKSSLRNIVCSKTLKVKDGCTEQASKLCKEIAEVAHKEMSDPSHGILAFEVFQDPFDASNIHFWERYLDNARMGRFNTSEAYRRFMEEVQDYLEKPVGMALYDWRNGQLGPLAVQGGPKGKPTITSQLTPLGDPLIGPISKDGRQLEDCTEVSFQLCFQYIQWRVKSVVFVHFLVEIGDMTVCGFMVGSGLDWGAVGEGGLDDATGAGGRGASSYTQTSDVVNLDVKRGEEGDSFGIGSFKFKLPEFKFPWDKEEEDD